MSTRLLQISLKACSLQAVPVHSLCLMQTSHYTPKSSPPSSRGANLPWQSTLVPAQMGKCFQSVIINSWASQCVTWMIQNELTMNMHHICGDLSGVQRQTGDTRLKNCSELLCLWVSYSLVADLSPYGFIPHFLSIPSNQTSFCFCWDCQLSLQLKGISWWKKLGWSRFICHEKLFPIFKITI